MKRETNQYLSLVEDFSREYLSECSRSYEHNGSLPEALLHRIEEIGFREIIAGGFSNNRFMSSLHLSELIHVMARGDAPLALHLMNGVVFEALQDRLNTRLDPLPVVPYENDSFLMLGSISDKETYTILPGKGGYELAVISLNDIKHVRYMGFSGTLFCRIGEAKRIKTISLVDRDAYLCFLGDIGNFSLSLLSGLLKSAIAYAHDYAKQRIAFGRPIIRFQAISQKLADLAIAYESFYHYYSDLLGNYSVNRLIERIPLAMDKAVDIVDTITEESVQIMGGYGYLKDYPAEKRMRDGQVLKLMLLELKGAMASVRQSYPLS